MLFLQREKRLGLREQFELEHFDASLAAAEGTAIFEQFEGFDDSFSNLPSSLQPLNGNQYQFSEYIKKTKFKVFKGKVGSQVMKK